MKTKKSKKNIKIRDLKPSKDAKGGRFAIQRAVAGASTSKAIQASSLNKSVN